MRRWVTPENRKMSTVEIEDSTPGRPAIRIDLTQVEQLCQIGCTLREVASFCKCSEDTIQRVLKRERDQTFTEFYEQWAALGDVSIRRAQYQKAVGGDVKMQIWLGKQRLGQSDKQDINHKVQVTKVKAIIQPGRERDRG